jgi:acyl-CoA synthetase (AMP-forming)/AMP-acid ligase II
MRAENLSSLVELLRRRAAARPGACGYTFLDGGEAEGASLTYAGLDRRSRQVATLIRGSATRGDRVLLLYPPGLEFIPAFFGCLYAGVVAVPTYPPNPLRPSEGLRRLQAVAAEAGCAAVLCTAEVAARLPALLGAVPALAGLPVLATDGPGADDAGPWREPDLTPDDLAFLQYTSGSTAAPRGVMVSHGNLLHNLTCQRDGAGIGPGDVGVSWLPVHHDMGLLSGILQPLFSGFPSYLMPPLSFVQRPLRWLQAVTRYRATLSGGPNFGYDLCGLKVAPGQRTDLDLSSWRVAYNGAEPVRRDTLERFGTAFGPCGFRADAFHPVYGLAEATLLVSGGRLCPGSFGAAAGGGEGNRVSCGRPCPGTAVLIVDPQRLTPVPPGGIGEIWVSGPSVARGYWGCPEETARTFGARLADSGAGPFLRTGDLGFLRAGELFITGRLKDVIIIRGRKHHPQDLEQTVESSHAVLRANGAAAVSLNEAEEERLLILAEVHPRHRARPAELHEVVGAIRQAVAERHEVQAHAVLLVPWGGLPRTTSGKLQRHACRRGYLEGAFETILRWPERAAGRGAWPTEHAAG